MVVFTKVIFGSKTSFSLYTAFTCKKFFFWKTSDRWVQIHLIGIILTNLSLSSSLECVVFLFWVTDSGIREINIWRFRG